MEETPHAKTGWPVYTVTGLTILAPAMGGSTELWAQAVLAFGAGLLLIFFPPRKSLGLVPNVAFGAFFLLALAAFVPATSLAWPQWRIDTLKLGLQLPGTLSPQPWLTLEASCLLFLGLAWSYYLLTFEWSRRWREKACQLFSLGILCLAAALTVASIRKERIPFWPEVEGFGFFPNRNQTSNVLGLSGIMIYAIGLQHFQQRRKDWWLWLASLSLICWALILTYSRAGIILFFSGALAWHIWWMASSRMRGRSIVTAIALLFLFGVLLINGGETLTRFAAKNFDVLSSGSPGRTAIYRDTFTVLGKMPIIGDGLANFPPMFALDRRFSATSNEVIHPESDWLWATVEMGWLAPLLLAGLFGWWLKQCTPFEPGTSRRLRVAAVVCGCGFVLHGLFDVSGHRFGALWPALFFASVAVHPNHRYRTSTAVTRLFRVIGTLFIGMACWWFASVAGAHVPPTTASTNRSRAVIATALERGDYQTVLDQTSEALKFAPLNWKLYTNRATAEALLFSSLSDAKRDFALARYLVPYWPEVALEEGQIWIAAGEPDLAFNAWAEALKRSRESAPDIYGEMFSFVKSDPALMERWRELAGGDKRCSLIFLGCADRFEFEIERDHLLAQDPELRSFAPDELNVLFSQWYEKGDKLSLAQTLREHPEWQKIAWRQLARTYADYQDYRQAFETAERFVSRPDLSEDTTSTESTSELALRFRANRSDPDAGVALSLAQAKEGKVDQALTTLAAIRDLPGAPKYVPALEAELWARKKEWQKAWASIAPLLLSR